jgi:aminopeptidase N
MMNAVKPLGRIIPQGRILARLFAGFVFIFVPAWNIAGQAQMPPIGPGVSQELARWRAARYSDVRYKLNLTLEKMSPVLKGTIEIRLKVSEPGAVATGFLPAIILDWRKIKGSEALSTISNVVVNGVKNPVATAPGSDEHLVFRDGVVLGENVIKLDFTSPILTSGSAITRYIDKEDGSEYIYSLFVPSDASTAFPVFDQPDLKARFKLHIHVPNAWNVVSNEKWDGLITARQCESLPSRDGKATNPPDCGSDFGFDETKPISTYVFAFAAGPWERVSSPHVSKGSTSNSSNVEPSLTVGLPTAETSIYVRKSQASKFQPHAAEVFRLNREAIKYFEQYFDYKFPFPKYDLVLIPEFPFGGMEHAGATFLRESAIIFPQEPTKGDHISRATLIFHEAAHQWFGDTVTMRWFDDLWLKEGFATFMGYKALEKIMPEMNAWKVFYERVKQAAYQTDATKGTTAIYQPIANLSAAKSAYGNIVYNKAPAFLRQAEFYLGEDKFQTAVRAFLKKYEYANAGWEDLTDKFEIVRGEKLSAWSRQWVVQSGVPFFRSSRIRDGGCVIQDSSVNGYKYWSERIRIAYLRGWVDRRLEMTDFNIVPGSRDQWSKLPSPIPDPVKKILRREDSGMCFDPGHGGSPLFIFPNYGDYGYGIFLLDDKSREYVLKNIQNEKDPFLRSMMWGALWDSVREGELDPRVYVELAIKNLPSEKDETMTASIIGRVATAMNYYLPTDAERVGSPHVSKGSTSNPPNVEPSLTVGLRTRFESVLLARMRSAATAGERQTFFRAFVANGASEKARATLKEMLSQASRSAENHPVGETPTPLLRKEGSTRVSTIISPTVSLRTKDKFDIVTRLLILNDPEAPRLLADLEKTETSDDAKRYAYAARAGIATAENKAKYWDDFVNNKTISESWIEAAFGPWNSIRHSELTLPYLERALKELPNHKRSRKIFFVNGWLGAFIGGQRSEEALSIVNKFLADNPNLDNDLRLKILENVDLIERAVSIRKRF